MKKTDIILRISALLLIGVGVYVFLRTGSALVLIPAYLVSIAWIVFRLRNNMPFSWIRYAITGVLLLLFAVYNFFSTGGESTVGIIPAMILFAISGGIYWYNHSRILKSKQ